ARKRARRELVQYDRSPPKPSIVPNRDRSNKLIVDTGPDVLADRRFAFRATGLVRVVRGDVAGRDVRALADLGIADVGQVRHLRACADARVLDLAECPRLCSRLESGAGAKVTNRADDRGFADRGVD